MYDATTLWKAPDINPLNRKARTIPGFNPINLYGRVFFFSWFGFLIAFWSWYAFPPLMTITIAKDLKLSGVDIANSNIIALAATLLVRLVAGPACDQYGPRFVFAACLLAGAIPTALAGVATTRQGLMIIRFFIGILGASFVPCQVWTTAFFDKNVVGSANALTAGLGNAGGGITYFLMPAIFDSMVKDWHLSDRVAWRVTFIMPFICITATAFAIVFLCPDTPNGRWSDRQPHAHRKLASHGTSGAIVDNTGGLTDHQITSPRYDTHSHPGSPDDAEYGKHDATHGHEARLAQERKLEIALGEVVVNPSFGEAMGVVFSWQTLMHCASYFCSFGTELAINSILGAYYLQKFPSLGQTGSGRWAAMFGLVNIIFRPLGGIIADIIYKRANVWGKKAWIHFLGIVTGVLLIVIGVVDSHDKGVVFGLIVCMAFFLDAGNGANYALIPHVHPHANGIISGFTGAAGNLGGIVFAIIFRYYGRDYGKVFWIIGVMHIAISVSVGFIRPIPKGQIGGH